jgi:hypothetical protein
VHVAVPVGLGCANKKEVGGGWGEWERGAGQTGG